jgi:DNA-binding MarR family transcriptional regulator
MQGEAASDRANSGGTSAAADAPSLELEKFLPYRLNVLASLVSQALSRIYAARYEIGVPEWRVLVTLGQYGVMSGKAIGAHTHMHKTKVSRAVALLERRRLLARRTNPTDLREALFSLAPAGRAIYEELAPAALDFAQRLVEPLDHADRAVLDRAIVRLIEHSSEMASEQEPISNRSNSRPSVAARVAKTKRSSGPSS